MNRIYQGRITKAERQNVDKNTPPEARWLPFAPEQATAEWQRVLWEHHELFQDAVNYYLVCLLSLVSQAENQLFGLRQQITSPESELFIWGPFRRKGATRPGLRESVAKYLTPGNATPTLEECAVSVLGGWQPPAQITADEAPRLLDLALSELLAECDGDGAIQQKGREMLPRFCWPPFNGAYPCETTVGEQAAGEARLFTELHLLTNDAERKTFAHELSLSWVVKLTKGGHDFTAERSRDRLRKAVAHFFQVLAPKDDTERKTFFKQRKLAVPTTRLGQPIHEFLVQRSTVQQELEELLQAIESTPESALPAIPPNNRGFSDKIESALLFQHFPREFTHALLCAVFPRRDPAKSAKPAQPRASANPQYTRYGDDAIKLARGSRGFIFRAFTSLACWGKNDAADLAWKAFDIAAFKEALKAIHQIDAKGEERAKERAQKIARRNYQQSPSAVWAGNTETEEPMPPKLAGDPRIGRLQELLSGDLAEEYSMTEGERVGYGLQPRTIRGFRDLRKRWNTRVEPGETFSKEKRERLLADLRAWQKESPELVGSVRLFEALLLPENWLIWREPTLAEIASWRETAHLHRDAEFARDPVQSLTDASELDQEIERLSQPVRLTPADARFSRRQSYLSELEDLTAKGRFDAKNRTIEVTLALSDQGSWRRETVRLHFSAPRVWRDQLVEDAQPEGASARWQQPIMQALGISAPQAGRKGPLDFAHMIAVALMPECLDSGERRFLLNFPVTLDPAPLVAQLKKQERWPGNFAGGRDEPIWLHWPSTRSDKLKGDPWWADPQPFRVLSVDLGQRDAGAFALLDVTPGAPPRPLSRKIGNAGQLDWYATVSAMGLLRLPGEDARIVRDGQWQEELSGERGRLADAAEWEEARQICAALGLEADAILGVDARRYSFPELNDRLLFALRRAQSRLARVQSWSAIRTDEQRRSRVKQEILALDEDPLGLKPLVQAERWPEATARLITEAQRWRTILPAQLVRVANRVLPLRGRNWEWAPRTDTSNAYVLRQTEPGPGLNKKVAGQRGLSMERLEQLEELRRRCQSLNRALQQTPGEPPRLGTSGRGLELPDPCPEVLEKLDELREQRVNQTAHLILAQALGVRLKLTKSTDQTRRACDLHGEYEKFREPADFIVLEDLGRYLASQGRSRDENTRLMKWCHRQILKKLRQLAEPYGISVLEAQAAYSSRFCSRSGVAGFRAVELTPESAGEFRWRKHLDRLVAAERGKRRLTREEREESEQVSQLFAELRAINAELLQERPARPKWRTLLAPMPGGPIFIPMRGPAMQADINAAINLGLRAIAAPEIADIHVRIRSERKEDKLQVRADNLREKKRWDKHPREIRLPDPRSRDALASEARPNFFVDIGNVAKFDHACIDGQPFQFASGRGLWGSINQDDWLRVNALNNDRLEKMGRGRPLPEGPVHRRASAIDLEDDIPM